MPKDDKKKKGKDEKKPVEIPQPTIKLPSEDWVRVQTSEFLQFVAMARSWTYFKSAEFRQMLDRAEWKQRGSIGASSRPLNSSNLMGASSGIGFEQLKELVSSTITSTMKGVQGGLPVNYQASTSAVAPDSPAVATPKSTGSSGSGKKKKVPETEPESSGSSSEDESEKPDEDVTKPKKRKRSKKE